VLARPHAPARQEIDQRDEGNIAVRRDGNDREALTRVTSSSARRPGHSSKQSCHDFPEELAGRALAVVVAVVGVAPVSLTVTVLIWVEADSPLPPSHPPKTRASTSAQRA
jgi:hypothetical protein